MALDAVVFPQDPFTYTTTSTKDLYSFFYDDDNNQDHHLQPSFENFPGYQTDHNYPNYYATTNYSSPPSMVPHFNQLHLSNPNPDADGDDQPDFHQLPLDHTITMVDSNNMLASSSSARAKRRRARSKKNKEELENQRMTHIAVERNRRKQMNEYLSMLRSLMPDSYVQRGDQASIIGGAINFVKELEQQVQFLGSQKPNHCVPFSQFFTFPQYSARSSSSSSDHESAGTAAPAELPLLECKTSSIAADIEVTMVESHASLKVRSKKLPKQLLKIVSGLDTLHLTVLHLNVVTADDIVLYSISLKIEEECTMSSVDEIATAVHQMLATIQEEAMLNLN